MTIELRDGRYFSRFFFQDLPAFNVMGALFRDDENGRRWTIIYRMRYFRDEKVFDSEDDRSWYRVTMRDAAVDEPEAVAELEKFCSLLDEMTMKFNLGDHPVEIVIVQSDDPVVIYQRLSSKPWWNAKAMGEQA